MMRSDEIAELAAALVAFGAEAKNPPKDRSGRTGNQTYSYADLAEVLDAVRPVLAKHDLAVTQEIQVDTDRCVVGAATTIIHKSGQRLEHEPLWIPAGKEAKDYGAAASYSRRYGLMAALNLAASEDAQVPSGARPPAEEPAELTATEGQLAKLETERKDRGITREDLAAEMQSCYGTSEPKQLTRSQVAELTKAVMTVASKPAEDEPPDETDLPESEAGQEQLG